MLSGLLEVKIKLPHDSKCIYRLGLLANDFTMLCNVVRKYNQELCEKKNVVGMRGTL